MRRPTPRDLSFHSAAKRALLALVVALFAANAALAQAQRPEPENAPGNLAVAIDDEALRLGAGVSSLWLGWEAGVAPPAESSAPPALVGWALRGAPEGEHEARIAQRIAEGFWAWAESELPAVPEFLDAERPAPEEWARKAMRGFVRDEAQALHDALEAPKAKNARSLVPGFTKARFRRIAALNGGQVATMRRNEQARGLAVYTAYHALLHGRHDSYAPGEAITSLVPGFRYTQAPAMREALLAKLRAVASGATDDYPPEVSGFAIALLLDRTRHDWRRELQVGWKPLDALLANPVRPFSQPSKGSAE